MKFAIVENEFGDIGIDENIVVETSEEDYEGMDSS